MERLRPFLVQLAGESEGIDALALVGPVAVGCQADNVIAKAGRVDIAAEARMEEETLRHWRRRVKAGLLGGLRDFANEILQSK